MHGPIQGARVVRRRPAGYESASPNNQAGRALGTMGSMTVIKINAITVSPDSGDELAKRFAARAGAIDNQDGFEGFELLRPTDERTTWLVVTRWRDDDVLQGVGLVAGLRPRAPVGGRAGGWTGPAAGRREQRAVVVRGRGRLRGKCQLDLAEQLVLADLELRVTDRTGTMQRTQLGELLQRIDGARPVHPVAAPSPAAR